MLSAAGFFKYVWSFSWHQALKGSSSILKQVWAFLLKDYDFCEPILEAVVNNLR